MPEQEYMETKYIPGQDRKNTKNGGKPEPERAERSDSPKETRQLPGRVWLVGAGPGAPDLITKRGYDLLQRADVVVYDALILPETLKLIPENVEKIYVGKRAGAHSVPQEEIQQILIREANLGKRVVRLKGGDPYVFGRGGEEALALAECGIPCETVPGVTSAVAVPEAFGIPVTHRGLATSFTVITGHGQMKKGNLSSKEMESPAAFSMVPETDAARKEMPGNPQPETGRDSEKSSDSYRIDYDALVRTGGTLLFLMGLSAARTICQGLMDAGMKKAMPAAAISKGTTAAGHMVLSTVERLAEDILAAGLEAPAILVVGEVCALAPLLNQVSSDGSGASAEEGIHVCTICASGEKATEPIGRASSVLSPAFSELGGKTPGPIGRASSVLSPASSEPGGNAPDSLGSGITVVVTRQAEKAEAFSDRIRAMGMKVCEVPAIRIQKPDANHRQKVMSDLQELCGKNKNMQNEAEEGKKEISWLIFTSANGVNAFFELLYDARLDLRSLFCGSEKKFAAVGSKTSEALKKHGIRPDLVPEEYTGEALGKALWKRIAEEKGGRATGEQKEPENAGKEEAGDGRKENPENGSSKAAGWFFGASRTDGGLEKALVSHGIPFKTVPVYETVSAVKREDAEKLAGRIAEGVEHFLFTFTSTSCVRNLAECVDLRGQTAVCIGEKTAKAAREAGMQVITAKECTQESMLETIQEINQSRGNFVSYEKSRDSGHGSF